MNEVDVLSLNDNLKILKSIRLQRPFMIRTGMDLARDFNQFLEKTGHESIEILQYVSTCGTRKDCLVKTLSMVEYLKGDYLDKGWFVSKNYLKNESFIQYESTLFAAFPDKGLHRMMNRRKPVAKNIWLSPPNKFTGLHYDALDNFNIQIQGQKTFYLAPPQCKNFYPGKIRCNEYHVSDVCNLFDYDQVKFSEFAGNIQDFYRATLNFGDLLFIPSFWWHQVHTVSEGLAVNINWWYPDFKMILKHLDKTFGAICLQIYRHNVQKYLL